MKIKKSILIVFVICCILIVIGIFSKNSRDYLDKPISGSLSASGFQTSYFLKRDNGKNINFWVKNKGDVSVKISINRKNEKVLAPGESAQISDVVSTFDKDYKFRAGPTPNGGKVNIDYRIFQSESSTNSTSKKNNSENISKDSNERKPIIVVADSTSSESKKDDLELLEYGKESDEFWGYIVGKIKNNTDEVCDYVKIEISLYDSDNNLVGTTFDNVTNLEPQGVWKFRAVVVEKNVAKYRITNISGW